MFVFFKLSWLKTRTKKLGIQYLAQGNSIFKTLFWAPQLQLFTTLIKSASESLVVELLVQFMAHPMV
jgi:ABC-type lipopolysaccharide export system ATPase subunit